MARERLAAGDLFRLTSLLGSRINHLANLHGRKSADFRMLIDDGFILGEVNAEGFIVSDLAFDPLDIRAKLT